MRWQQIIFLLICIIICAMMHSCQKEPLNSCAKFKEEIKNVDSWNSSPKNFIEPRKMEYQADQFGRTIYKAKTCI